MTPSSRSVSRLPSAQNVLPEFVINSVLIDVFEPASPVPAEIWIVNLMVAYELADVRDLAGEPLLRRKG